MCSKATKANQLSTHNVGIPSRLPSSYESPFQDVRRCSLSVVLVDFFATVQICLVSLVLFPTFNGYGVWAYVILIVAALAAQHW